MGDSRKDPVEFTSGGAITAVLVAPGAQDALARFP